MASEARRKAREAGWAGLPAGDAGNAEEELGVQQNTSAVYPMGRVALALRARRHTAQLDFVLGPVLFMLRYWGRGGEQHLLGGNIDRHSISRLGSRFDDVVFCPFANGAKQR